MIRVGLGYDVHRLTEGRKLILGGVDIPFERGLLGHSDADVLLHAIIDALFGAAALFNSQGEYVTQITAIEHSRILFLPQRLIKRMIEREPEIAENYIRYLSERILFLNRKIYFLTAGTAEQRLASFLLDNLSEGEYSEMPMPMHRLADALNMSRASLYRAFDLLIESGAVSKQGKLVCISNAELLNQV